MWTCGLFAMWVPNELGGIIEWRIYCGNLACGGICDVVMRHTKLLTRHKYKPQVIMARVR